MSRYSSNASANGPSFPGIDDTKFPDESAVSEFERFLIESAIELALGPSLLIADTVALKSGVVSIVGLDGQTSSGG
ncbi:hypothetical protein A5751_24620 [Mycolicibacterium fortuitum]|nr:hypothetical protein A5751_24620 [Mycolicibacterium fortuitum]